WVMGWIRGNLGLALLLLAGALALAVMDIRSYRPMFDNIPIATLSLHTLGSGSHQLRLVNHKGIEQSYPLAGDEYQLVINQFRWATRFSGMGMGHGYRIDHLAVFSGAKKIKSDVPVSSSEYLDVWGFFHRYFPQDFFLSATTVSTLPRKVVDGGMYELVPDAFDINIVPLNQVAKEAELLANVEEVVVPEAMPEVSTPEPAVSEVITPEATPPVSDVPPEEKAPKQLEMPGAHIQATPATIIEKSAD